MPDTKRDRIRGSLLGGAAGDALGYPVEFWSYGKIIKKYGESGITSYALDFDGGQALISDDTQMTLFTANGILRGDTCRRFGGSGESLISFVHRAYIDWLDTQVRRGTRKSAKASSSWLTQVPELYAGRAPGNTCMSALYSGECGTVERPINNSKGCGGIMRVAPAALYHEPADYEDRKRIDWEGAEISAITHGHSLGYIPAAVATHIISVGVYGGCTMGDTMEDAVAEAVTAAEELSAGDEHLRELRDLMDRAISLSHNDLPDIENIRRLGEGWVAEETLAIAVYCSLRYRDDFSKGLIASVNHSGDADSTGAVTGNILGAWLGYDAIEEKWKRDLELRQVILELADDLSSGPRTDADGNLADPEWKMKYMENRRMV